MRAGSRILSAPPKPLYEYQSAALVDARGHVAEGRRKVLIVMPTGGGKTRTAAEAVRVHVAKKGHVVWLAHRRELIKQALKTLREYGLRVGALGLDGAAPVQVASIQALVHPSRREVPPATMVVADEAHHLLAKEWRKLAEVYADCLLLGLTATPERSDGQPLGDIFNGLVVAAQVADLIALHDLYPTQGLVPCDVKRPEHDDGTPWVLGPDEVAQRPVDAYKMFAERRRAVVFAPNVHAAKEFAKQFENAGIRADVIHSKTPKDERDSTLTLFARGEIRVLCNVNVLTEGWDDPGCDVCIIARGCDHASLYLQMVGRVMRPSPGKLKALLIDLRGVSWIHGLPAATRKFSLDGVAIEAEEVEEEKHCPVCNWIMAGRKCLNPDCKRTGKSLEQVTPHSVNARMVHVDWNEPREHDSQSARVAKLAQWIRDALAGGGSMQSAFKKFETAYGYFPNREKRDALLLAHARESEPVQDTP